MYQMSENINELMSALSKAQGQIRCARKDKINPFHKSKYADLAGVWDACRSALSEHGLAVVQAIDTVENNMVLKTILGHASGQWMSSSMPITLPDTKPQTIGSILTYYRRYSLSSMIGIAPDDGEDDDGQTAQDNYKEPVKKPDVKPLYNKSPKVEPLQKQDPNPEEPYVPKISNAEIKILQGLLEQLAPEDRKTFGTYMANRKWATLNDVPRDSFANLKNNLLQEIAKSNVRKSDQEFIAMAEEVL